MRVVAENSRAAVVAWREALVESLGARICGEGDGPTQAEIDKLAQLEEAEARAQQDYAVYLMSISTSSSNASKLSKRSRSMS